MDKRFSAGEWIMLTPEERVERCLSMAQEARALAATETEKVGGAYRELAVQFFRLATEIEEAHKRSQPQVKS